MEGGVRDDEKGVVELDTIPLALVQGGEGVLLVATAEALSCDKLFNAIVRLRLDGI